MMKISREKGFTLIELLVVVAIIGMLVSVIMVSFGQARLRSRDSKRLSDIQQVRTGLDLYFNLGGGYPSAATWNTGAISCNGQFVMNVPFDAILESYYVYVGNPAQTTTACGQPGHRDYYVSITTEGPTDWGPAGTYFLSPRGLTTSAPF